MGYVYNHLATLICGVFAAVLTLLWPMFVDYAEVLDSAFLYSVPIMWFLTAVCFVAQKSTDYMHGTHPVTTTCLLYTSPSPRDLSTSRMPSSA